MKHRNLLIVVGSISGADYKHFIYIVLSNIDHYSKEKVKDNVRYEFRVAVTRSSVETLRSSLLKEFSVSRGMVVNLKTDKDLKTDIEDLPELIFNVGENSENVSLYIRDELEFTKTDEFGEVMKIAAAYDRSETFIGKCKYIGKALNESVLDYGFRRELKEWNSSAAKKVLVSETDWEFRKRIFCKLISVDRSAALRILFLGLNPDRPHPHVVLLMTNACKNEHYKLDPAHVINSIESNHFLLWVRIGFKPPAVSTDINSVQSIMQSFSDRKAMFIDLALKNRRRAIEILFPGMDPDKPDKIILEILSDACKNEDEVFDPHYVIAQLDTQEDLSKYR